ncbi:MAG: DUF1385 domain-containing protein [Gaiellaceae bacterium]
MLWSRKPGVRAETMRHKGKRLRRLFLLSMLAKQSKTMYGGQAVIEGVMMRSPGYWSVAVRKPNGEVAEVWHPVDSLMKRHLIFRLPVIRGVMALGESLAIGFRALAISTEYAAEGEEGEEGIELGRWAIALMFIFAIGFALALFKVGPAATTRLLLPNLSNDAFVLIEGAIRVSVLVAYMALVGLLPDIRRLWAYHGAEHKVINAFEAKEELTPEKVEPYSIIHPRCGTAFMLWVMVIAIFVYWALGLLVGHLSLLWLIVSRIVMLFPIAGIAYELIRFAGKHRSSRILKTLLAPGLWLQRLTTREPDRDQLEVSIAAFTRVYELETARASEPAIGVVAQPIDVIA